jgi:S1-C subfamily serine protease
VQAGESVTITAHFVVPQSAMLTADSGRNLQWVASAAQAQAQAPPPAQPAPGGVRDAYGFVLAQTPQGVLVRQVAPNSVAQRAGLQPGDIIMTINGQRVTEAAQARELIESSPQGQLAVSVRRSNMLPRPVMATSSPDQ